MLFMFRSPANLVGLFYCLYSPIKSITPLYAPLPSVTDTQHLALR